PGDLRTRHRHAGGARRRRLARAGRRHGRCIAMSKAAATLAKAEADVLQELRPGQSVELLKELHILTREGRLNQDSRRKLKQVYHLFQFIEKLLVELPEEGAHATLADHGAGKSYLGFILYDLFFGPRGGGRVYGIETRADL